jgi:hypothetical protein
VYRPLNKLTRRGLNCLQRGEFPFADSVIDAVIGSWKMAISKQGIFINNIINEQVLIRTKSNPVKNNFVQQGESRVYNGAYPGSKNGDSGSCGGLDGTPIPSFSGNIKLAEAWDLVHSLRRLQASLKMP